MIEEQYGKEDIVAAMRLRTGPDVRVTYFVSGGMKLFRLDCQPENPHHFQQAGLRPLSAFSDRDICVHQTFMEVWPSICKEGIVAGGSMKAP